MTALVNPTQEEALGMPIGTVFTIEGVLNRAEPATIEEPSYPGATSTYSRPVVNIEIEAGNEIWQLVSYMGKFLYAGGCLENLRDSQAKVGETIAIQAKVTLRDGRPNITIGYGAPRLLVPSHTRQHAYNAERSAVSSTLEGLQTLITEENYPHARAVFSRLRVDIKLTKQEQRQLGNMMRQLPLSEQPVYERRDNYSRDALKKAFGVNIEALNGREFLDFARRVLCGEIENPQKPDRVDQSYLYRFLHLPMFTQTQAAELIEAAIKARVGRLEPLPDTHDEYWDDYWVAETSIEWAVHFPQPASVSALAWVIDYCLERCYFDARLSSTDELRCPRRFDFLDKAIDSLSQLVQEEPERGPAFDGFDTGKLLAWRDALSVYPFTGNMADKIRSIIAL